MGRWLHEERGLALKPGARIRSTGRPFTFLGYRIDREGVEPSAKMMRRFEHKVRRAAARGPDALRRTLVAYRGMVTFG